MFCPKCGCHGGPDGSRFCRNCGFRLDGVAQLLARNGAPEGFIQSMPPTSVAPNLPSPRKKGIKKGGKILFASVAFFPIFFGLCFLADNPGPLLVPISIFFAGLMRMLYARIFEDEIPQPPAVFHPITQPVSVAPPQPVSFMPGNYQQQPASLPQPSVPTTGNLAMPASVTEQPTYPLNRS